MKKIISTMLAVLMLAGALSALTISSFAAEPVVFKAEFFTEKVSDPEKNIQHPASLAADGSVRFIFQKSTSVGKIEFRTADIDKSVHKFIKIRYKYHFTDSKNKRFKAMLRQGHSGGSTNHTLFYLASGNDVWHDSIAEITWATSGKGEENTYTIHPIRESDSVYAGDVFYIDYVAFFATKEEAEAFALDDKTYTEPPLVEESVLESKPETDNVNADAVVLEKKTLTNDKHRITVTEMTEDGRTFMRTEPDASKSPGLVPKLDRYGIKLNTDTYKYMKICYRTNLHKTSKISLEVLNMFAKNYSFYPNEPEKWESVIFFIDTTTGMSLNQYHFSTMGPNPAEALEGFYTDIEYIAFFPTLEAAKEYKKDTSGVVRVDAEALGGSAPKPEEKIEIVEREDNTVEGAPVILTGKSVINTPYRLAYEEKTEDDITYIHCTPDVAQNLVPKIDRFGLKIDTDTYKYLKIGFRTNVEAGTKLRYQPISGYTNLFEFEVAPGEDWQSTTIFLDNSKSEKKELVQAHFSPFGNVAANALTGKYVDVAYVAFFKTQEEADKFDVTNANRYEISVHAPYMTGYKNADGTFSFKPTGTMTRAEACTIVARLKAGSDELVPAETASKLTDVSGAWYSKYITYLEAQGILKSYSGAFTPTKPITRAEFVELIYNLGLVKAGEEKPTFTDVPATHERHDVIIAAASAGLVTGYANADKTYSFKPDNTITRAEVVTVVNRALGREIAEITIPSGHAVTEFSDVKGDYWAYGQIAEATTEHKYYSNMIYAQITSEVWATDGVKTGDATKAIIAEVDKLASAKKDAILNSESDYSTITGKKYYVSSKNGSDTNDGLSPETPFASPSQLNRILMQPGDGVLFERGTLYRGHFVAKEGVTYSAYGEGEKPTFYGSPFNGAETGTWTKLESNPNIWEYSENLSTDVGTIVFNHGEAVGIKKCLKENSLEFVKQNFDFWYDGSLQKLYLYLDKGNPAELYDSIEFNTHGNIFRVSVNDVTFDNLCIMYGGSHGIGTGGVRNVHVKNCVFGWIGGALQNQEARYGNGVEFWAPSSDCSVKNCYVYEVYDAGITFQQKGDSGATCTFNRIVFEENLIEKCVYNIEYFLRQTNSNDDFIANTTIRNNILRFAGESWGIQRPDGKSPCAHIKGWDSKNQSTNFVIEGNIMDRGNNWLIHIGSTASAKYLPLMKNNTYIQYEGGKFGRWNGVEIPFSKNAHHAVATGNCENTTELYLSEPMQ